MADTFYRCNGCGIGCEVKHGAAGFCPDDCLFKDAPGKAHWMETRAFAADPRSRKREQW